MTVKSLEKLSEVPLGVVWPRRGLRMVLDRENGSLPVADTFHSAIIEVTMCHLKFFRAGNGPLIAPNREAVVL